MKNIIAIIAIALMWLKLCAMGDYRTAEEIQDKQPVVFYHDVKYTGTETHQ